MGCVTLSKGHLNKPFPATQIAQFSSGGTGLPVWGIFSKSLTHTEIDFVVQKTPIGVFSALKTKKRPRPWAFFPKTAVTLLRGLSNPWAI